MGSRSVRVFIRMIFLAECSVSLLDISFRGRFVNVKEFVVVFATNDQRDNAEENDGRYGEHFAI